MSENVLLAFQPRRCGIFALIILPKITFGIFDKLIDSKILVLSPKNTLKQGFGIFASKNKPKILLFTKFSSIFGHILFSKILPLLLANFINSRQDFSLDDPPYNHQIKRFIITFHSYD